ncbi:MAG: methyltransferase [Alphaproteobacteria bacterium]|nr:methyltransferase [Alphaproteobacteria bacterium]
MAQKQDIFTLMGGRVRLRRGRYNPTSDAVWLAAMAADSPAKTVLDIGIGTGGAALCLMANKPGVNITGIDISPEMLAECAGNAALNDRNIELINTDITKWRTDRTFDLVITNPPYFHGTPAKHNAHHNADLGLWARKGLARVRPRGTFVIIVDAAAAAEIIAAMAQKCGDIEIFPLFGAKQTAERILLRGRLGSRGPTILHAGLPMNTDAVLRDGLTIGAALSTLS